MHQSYFEQADEFVGKKIIGMRLLKPEECENIFGDPDFTTWVIILEDGSYILPSQDDEGNGPGALFAGGPPKSNKDYVFPTERT